MLILSGDECRFCDRKLRCVGSVKSDAISGQSLDRIAGFEFGEDEDIERRYM